MEIGRPDPPSDDRRWKIVGATMRRLGYRRDALIEVLHSVQDSFGFLEDEALRYVAQCLKVPLSSVYGVATFYHFFTLKPHGEHSCVVCTGTACYIKGAPDILQAIADEFGVEDGETTSDGKLSILSARCIGACGLAPAVIFDGEIAGKQSPDDVVNRLKRWFDNDA